MSRRLRLRAPRGAALRFLATLVLAAVCAVVLGLHPAHAETRATTAPSAPAAPKEAPAEPVGPAVKNGEPPTADLRSIPIGKGLPVFVSVGVYFFEVESFDDNAGQFTCTTDVRLRWTDPRLRVPVAERRREFVEYMGKEADAWVERTWTPDVESLNRVEAPTIASRRVRVFADGSVELLTRVTGRYKAHVDASRFPFDRQSLPIELVVREQTTDEVVLRAEREDVEFSRASHDAQLDAWGLGLVDMRRSERAGWSGEKYSRMSAALTVDRLATSGLAPIFIPLFASLLIPLLALWMNRATEDGFEVEAFELANMGIGGLFSVIALSFAIYSSYPVLASTDNTVTRLFGLNYATLALSLGIVVLFFQFKLPYRWFGRHVNAELFDFLAWALPLLVLSSGAAVLLAAAA